MLLPSTLSLLSQKHQYKSTRKPSNNRSIYQSHRTIQKIRKSSYYTNFIKYQNRKFKQGKKKKDINEALDPQLVPVQPSVFVPYWTPDRVIGNVQPILDVFGRYGSIDKAFQGEHRVSQLNRDVLVMLLFSKEKRNPVFFKQLATLFLNNEYVLDIDDFNEFLTKIGKNDSDEYLDLVIKMAPLFGVKFNTLSYELIINKYVAMGEYIKATDFFFKLEDAKVELTHPMFYSVFIAYRNQKNEEGVKELYLKYLSYLKTPAYGVLKVMMETYKNRKYLHEQSFVIEEMKRFGFKMTTPLIQNMIVQTSRMRDFTELKKYYDIIKNTDEIQPKLILIYNMIVASSFQGDPEFTMEIFNLLRQYKIKPDLKIIEKTVDILVLAQYHDLEPMLEILNDYFGKHPAELDETTCYSKLIGLYLKSHKFTSLSDTLDLLVSKLDNFPLPILFSEAMKVMSMLKDQFQSFEEFIKAFQSLREKYDIKLKMEVSVPLLIYIISRFRDRFVDTLADLVRDGMEINEEIFLILMQTASDMKDVETALLIIKISESYLDKKSIPLFSKMINFFSSEIRLDTATDLFNSLLLENSGNISTNEGYIDESEYLSQEMYASMIKCCLDNNSGEKAMYYYYLFLETYDRPIQKVRTINNIVNYFKSTNMDVCETLAKEIFEYNPYFPAFTFAHIFLPSDTTGSNIVERLEEMYQKYGIHYDPGMYSIAISKSDPEEFVKVFNDIYLKYNVVPTYISISDAVRKILSETKYHYLIDFFDFFKENNLPIVLGGKLESQLKKYFSEDAREYYELKFRGEKSPAENTENTEETEETTEMQPTEENESEAKADETQPEESTN
eukprot:TRINITY_DN12732_c0_g1_i1.p1 TRINITY_DN12732_c0_g1~~TRINITY_DN12732_c0_g1_i1.p1  ORF type:complete len:840 (+),score=180.10 TRINITY_DN12732_c0_g1_i1:29-2548(+)